MREITRLIHKYLRHDKKFPHIWCPGCGNGIVLGSLIRAVDKLGLSKDEVVLVSGIGCAARMPVYVDFNTLHTTHGRALAFATGIKLVKPQLKVIVVMGDGDALAIGGNHFIHAARRNVDLVAIIINNHIYGMTGGQSSPTTPYGMRTTTAPYRNIEHELKIAELAATAGAAFVGRSTVYHVKLLDSLIEQAIEKKGFGVVEVMSPCPVQYGRLNQLGDAVKMMQWQRDNSISVEKAKELPPEELEGKLVIGVLVDRDLPIYQEEYEKIIERAKSSGAAL